VLAYVVGTCFSLDLTVIRDTWTVLLASVAYGLVITVSAGTLMLAMSSLSRRSLYVGLAWAGLWIISGSVAAVLSETRRVSLRTELYQEEMERWVKANPPPDGVDVPDFRFGPRPRPRAAVRRIGPGPARAPAPAPVNDPWIQDWADASRQAFVRAQEREAEEQRGNWRPLFSYVGNLERIADQLLNADAAWVTIGRAVVRAREAAGPAMGRQGPPGFAGRGDERFLADQMVPQYPWQWSAGVLAGLLGLSTWTMTRRVKSLDRLK
jgi:hypothetical protein